MQAVIKSGFTVIPKVITAAAIIIITAPEIIRVFIIFYAPFTRRRIGGYGD